MNFYEIRNLITSGKRLEELNLRVTYYARVSSLKDEQLNSLDNQISYFENLINKNPNWKLIPGYVDEGVSGSSTKSRINFLKMIEDSKLGIFNLIITKEVSRFSRNLIDSIKYTEELTKNNVGIYFETNNLNTFDPNSEIYLNIMSTLAQEEVKRLSTRIKWGLHNAQKKGVVLGNKTYGYKKKKGILTINEEEAKVVRKIYELYTTKKYGIDKISYLLYKEGITNKNNKMIDSNTIKRIIRNPKYKGYYYGHTTEIIDYKTKKRVSIKDKDKVIYKCDLIPQIIDEQTWNLANKILKERYLKPNEKINKYELSGLLICNEHQVPFTRSTGSKRSKSITWCCTNYMKYRLASCVSPILKEDEILLILKHIFDDLFNNIDLEELITFYNSSSLDKIKLENIKNRIKDLYISNILTEEEFENKIKEVDNKLMLINDMSNIEDKIKKYFINKNKLELYINIFIDKIYVEKINNERKNILLKIKLKNIFKNKIYEFDNFSNKYKVVMI